jgi:hypothetical protein
MPIEANPHTQTPEEIVAEQITTLLERVGLLQADRSEEFQSSLAAGELKSEDWYHEIDLATAPKETADEQ